MQETTEEKFIQTKDIFTVAEELGNFLSTRTDKPAMPTGISSLDRIIWGLHKTELLVMASRPSQGKTSMTTDIAWRLAKQGFRVVYISLEMSASSVLERILCNEYMIDGWRLRTGLTEEVQRAKVSLDKLKGRLLMSPITIIDDYGFKTTELEEIIQTLKPDVVFIDHLQRVSMNGIKNRQEGLADYVQSCKRFCLKYKFACVLASQINRQGSNAENAMDFMKGTGEIEEGADTLIQLRWVGRDNFFADPENPTVDKKEYQVNILKQRNGPIDGVTLDFDVSHYRFSDRFGGLNG